MLVIVTIRIQERVCISDQLSKLLRTSQEHKAAKDQG